MSLQVNSQDVGSSILQLTEQAQTKLLLAAQKIATGKRLNSASDGAAELALSQSLNSGTREANTNATNSQMEKSMLAVADSDLSQISDNNQQIRDLALQASNGVYGSSERQAIQDQINQLQDENTRIAQSSSFNDKKLLDGSAQGTQVMAAQSSATSVSEAFKDATPSGLGIDSVDVSTPDNALALVNKIDQAQQTVTTRRSELGTVSNALDNNIAQNKVTAENLTASNSTINDADIAQEMVNLVQAKIQMSAAVTMQSQANSMNATVLNLLKTSNGQ
jgi:flagellin